MSEMVFFQDIYKYYDDVLAVDDLNLEVHPGEFFTLLGPSGSGKTTTLRMLAGLESISSGTIRIGDEDVSRLVPEKRNIGLVFQNYALFPHMTVAENVAFPLKMRKERQPEEKVTRVLELVGLSDYGQRYPAQLSGGQQQRVALARAFVFDPSILLMDEPLGALDRNLRDQMRIELKSLQARIGATVLYVTHDQDEALTMSDRIGVMHNGVLQQVASPQEMYEKPANSFVGRFIGDSSYMPAKRVSRGEQTALHIEGTDRKVVVCAENDVCSTDTGIFFLRPEKLELSTTEPSADRNYIRARVTATMYLGAFVHVLLVTPAGTQIKAVVDASAAWEGMNGEDVWVSWDTSVGRFLDEVN